MAAVAAPQAALEDADPDADADAELLCVYVKCGHCDKLLQVGRDNTRVFRKHKSLGLGSGTCPGAGCSVAGAERHSMTAKTAYQQTYNKRRIGGLPSEDCHLSAGRPSPRTALGGLPPMQVSLEVPGCPPELQVSSQTIRLVTSSSLFLTGFLWLQELTQELHQKLRAGRRDTSEQEWAVTSAKAAAAEATAINQEAAEKWLQVKPRAPEAAARRNVFSNVAGDDERPPARHSAAQTDGFVHPVRFLSFSPTLSPVFLEISLTFARSLDSRCLFTPTL